MEGWYVAKIKPQKQACLTSFLAQWDVEVFYPQILEPGKNKGALKPLFPTYIFCRLDPRSSVWPVARWAPGMAYFLGCEGEPVRVPDEMIEYLGQRVAQWNTTGTDRQLAQGDRVMVLTAPFAGLEGIFQRYIPGRQRCAVLLEVVGRLAAVECPEWGIRPVEQDLGGNSSSLAPAY